MYRVFSIPSTTRFHLLFRFWDADRPFLCFPVGCAEVGLHLSLRLVVQARRDAGSGGAFHLLSCMGLTAAQQ
jgi:hypothetical protein